ncbi:hypothetical protein BS50DRAFT_567217 [Corynespora cassiicola Philippines]|uniref:Uncharacterized protein n=1 Tax=Corynespora cassiicola Philippines TaxID=1448308 RepID=A0A2T2P9P7_CORCC|nr:hypothetical protein BS50DRAFT_567217 [Corynespora cassiicola Philippines]
MARTHSSYTASPTRFRSPQPSPHRETSEDGSQYEMDLDVLGLNSTFDSTGLEEGHEPQVDVVDTSDIEGPEDFTMNMTYWMTADLPLAQAKSQIKSRKEAKGKFEEVRGDAGRDMDPAQDSIEEGDRVVLEERETAGFNSASPTMRANGTTDGQRSGKALSETSMENNEKVRSYLSALPDTDMGDALTSTPLRIPKHNTLQVPSPAGAKARSLQATVEDYDTPRKPTQETVIHHAPKPSAEVRGSEEDKLRSRIADLESQLEQRELASKTRIVELETILSYTRSELDSARTNGYRQKDKIAALEAANQRQKEDAEATRILVENQLQSQKDELTAKMERLGEELQLESSGKLQNQRDDFERQLRALEEAKHAVEEHVRSRSQLLEQVRAELSKLRQSDEQEFQGNQNAYFSKHGADREDEKFALQEKLLSVQARADHLQAELEKATSEARAAREDAEVVATHRHAAEATNNAQASRISDLQAEVAILHSKLDAEHAGNATLDEEQPPVNISTDAAHKDQLGQGTSLEFRVKSLQFQLDSSRADVTAKDQELLRHIQDHEQLEQRLSTSQGRIESLENAISSLRQQLAEAHRDSARYRSDAERFERDLEDATDRLQDARAEADRRVADMERKLIRMKELKGDAERKLKEAQSENEELVEDQETKLDDVRSRAEDAVRKAGLVVEQERTEKKKLAKQLKKISEELEQLRLETATKAAQEDDSDDDSSFAPNQANTKDAEIENLRSLLRKQSASMRTLKTETSSLKKENARLISVEAESSVDALQSELESLRRDNEALRVEAEARREDFEAVNKAMDERLAAMMSKLLKERARAVVGKRDGQWAESMSKAKDERDFMGKVLMREWGRHEVGPAEEGEKQSYRYKYTKRP